jgi:hypothetical protein
VIGGNSATIVSFQHVRAINWSEGGVAVESRYGLPVDAVLTITIEDVDSTAQRAQTRVRHVSPTPHGNVRAGLAFLTFNPSVLAQVSTNSMALPRLSPANEGSPGAEPEQE